MKIGDFDLGRDVLIVAEIGNNHEGSYALAEELIGLAAQAGAGAVKFQTIVPERLVSPTEKERIRQLERFRLSYEEFTGLAAVAENEGVLFLSTPFDIQSARQLEPIVPAFKVSSGDNNFLPMIEVIAETGKPILMSTGFATMDELRRTKDVIESIWRRLGVSDQLALMHCTSCYPAVREDANLLAIRTLQELDVTVGYSDHTLGTEAAVLAVALGARIVEKHFTLRKDFSDHRDHQLSADPEELASLVSRVAEALEFLGTGEMRLQECEKPVAAVARRSIVAARDLEEGAVIGAADLTWLRPAGGLSPGLEEELIGKRVRRPICKGERILLDDIS